MYVYACGRFHIIFDHLWFHLFYLYYRLFHELQLYFLRQIPT